MQQEQIIPINQGRKSEGERERDTFLLSSLRIEAEENSRNDEEIHT